MGSLSLIAGFRENSLTSIFKMSHAQVKQTKQSTPHAMRRASTILSAVSSEIFSMSALFISALSSAAASSAAAESSEAAAFADKSVPAEREASFPIRKRAKLKEKIADEIFCVERSVLARDRG